MAKIQKYDEFQIAKLIPYDKNAKIHTEEQILHIANSISEFGFNQPIVVDENFVIMAGHGRFEAAKTLNLLTAPVWVVFELTEEQKSAYRIIDNTTNSETGYDEELLQAELKSLSDAAFDISKFGLNYIPPINTTKDFEYTTKIAAPIYTPSDTAPEINSVIDITKYELLMSEIDEEKNLTDEERTLLRFAASRHIVFNYQKIADLYAHSSPTVQTLMENSALVIIDLTKR